MTKLNLAVLAGLFSLAILAPLGAETPYDGPVLKLQGTNVEKTLDKVQTVVSSAESSARKGAASFDEKMTTGLNSISKSLDALAKSLNGITSDLSSAASAAGTSANGIAAGNGGCVNIPGTTTGTSCPQGTTGSQVGQTIKDFFTALGNLAKSFAGWVKAAWNEMNGPSKEEAPLTNAVNDIRTDWEKAKMELSAKKVNQSAGKMFSAIGTFIKSLFN